MRPGYDNESREGTRVMWYCISYWHYLTLILTIALLQIVAYMLGKMSRYPFVIFCKWPFCDVAKPAQKNLDHLSKLWLIHFVLSGTKLWFERGGEALMYHIHKKEWKIEAIWSLLNLKTPTSCIFIFIVDRFARLYPWFFSARHFHINSLYLPLIW